MTSPVLLNRMATAGGTYGEALNRFADIRAKRQDTAQKDVLFRRGIEDQDAIRTHMPGAVAGDPMAMTEILRRDPGTGLKVMDYTRQSQEKQRERLQQAALGTAASVVMTDDKAARPQIYAQGRAELQRMFPGQFDNLPEQYDDKLFLGMIASMFPPDMLQKIAQDRFGITAEELPSSVREWEYYNRLPKDQQPRYLEMKRSDKVVDVAGVPSSVSGGKVTPLSTLPAEAGAAATVEGAKTEARARAEESVKAQGDLPRVESNATEMMNALKLLKESDLGLIYGAASIAPVIPGSPQADVFGRWEQVQGKAFLEAFNTLKGAGQITEQEGTKATAAITRLSQRKIRPEEAQRAITELEATVSGAVERARKKAGKAAPAAAPAGEDPLGILGP